MPYICNRLAFFQQQLTIVVIVVYKQRYASKADPRDAIVVLNYVIM